MFRYFDYQKAIFKAELSSNEKLTALAIASHFNWADLNPAFPSNKTLAKETGLGERTVIRAKRALEEAGFLKSQQRFNGSSLLTPAIPTLATQAGGVSDRQGVLPHRQGGMPGRQPNSELNSELNYEVLIDKTREEEAVSLREKAGTPFLTSPSTSSLGETSPNGSASEVVADAPTSTSSLTLEETVNSSNLESSSLSLTSFNAGTAVAEQPIMGEVETGMAFEEWSDVYDRENPFPEDDWLFNENKWHADKNRAWKKYSGTDKAPVKYDVDVW
jgi:hypothetical protein